MRAVLDSSVLVAALVPAQANHEECARRLGEAGSLIYTHALNETFAILTGGALRFRIGPDETARLIQEKVLPRVQTILLDAGEIVAAHGEARSRGVRGGAVYDFMHLVAARKAGAEALFTLNVSDFLAFHRTGDPEIRRP